MMNRKKRSINSGARRHPGKCIRDMRAKISVNEQLFPRLSPDEFKEFGQEDKCDRGSLISSDITC